MLLEPERRITEAPDRLMYGGDWPVSILSGGYERVWAALSSLADELDPWERAQLLAGTAERFYGIALPFSTHVAPAIE